MRLAMPRLIIFFLVCLFSCNVGPKYEPPEIETPTDWESPPCLGLEKEMPECFVWWECLNDPVLNSLIQQAANQNLDLAMAAERILQAREELKGVDTYKYPHIDGSATYGHAQFNQTTLNRFLNVESKHSKGQRNIDLFEFGFDAEWEIDLFGMNRHQCNALRAQLEAAEADFRQVWVTLSAEIARTYVELRALQQRKALLKNHIETQKETLQLIGSLATTGFLAEADIKTAEEQLLTLIAQKPQIELAIFKTIHRISILLGYPPCDLVEELKEFCTLPTLPTKKPVGLPSELLRRRPDIQKAERDLAASIEEVGVAVASLFPRFSLRGFIGDISSLCSGSFTWFAGSQMLFPIFNSKLLQQDVKINQSKARQAMLAYQRKVLEALEEAENGIAGLHYELERNRVLLQAKQASTDTYELTMQLYRQGFKDYLEVLVAYRSQIATEEAFIQSEVETLFHYISLYKAIGGGWDIENCLGS